MAFYQFGKFNLSTDAMKVAARSLQLHVDYPTRAAIALREGLHCDANHLFRVWRRKNREGLLGVDAVLNWVIGNTGSGKQKLTFAAARHAARHGYRVVTITTDTAYPSHWHSQDRAVVDLRDGWPHSADQIKEKLAPLSNPELISLIVLVPFTMRCSDVSAGHVSDVTTYIIDNFPPRSCLVVDEQHCALPPVQVDALRAAFKRKQSRAIFSCKSPKDADERNIGDDDTLILMRLDADPCVGIEWKNLEANTGYLRAEDGSYIPIEGANEFRSEPERILSKPRSKAIARLEKSLRKYPPDSHMDYLETMARVCGYRNWHAAQGRD